MTISPRHTVPLFLLSVLAFLAIISFSGCSNEPGKQKLSNLEDKALFKLFIREMPVGNQSCSIDTKGNYFRKMTINLGGQTINSLMKIIPDQSGDWKQIEIENPLIGQLSVQRQGNTARYKQKTRIVKAKIPRGDYTFYDDQGFLFESVMFKKYDLEKKGKQRFVRFRIPEAFSERGNQIELTVHLSRKETRTIKGKPVEFMVFSYKWLGANGDYWLDKDYKICLFYSKVYQTHAVREGFEEMLPFAPSGTVISENKKTVFIPMRDGVKLSTDLYFPGGPRNILGEKKYPVILIRTPYKKENREVMGLEWAKKGYVCAVQDVRGRFASEGEWEPFVNEARDGYDTIEYLAARVWSTGKVGMFGWEYNGMAQMQTAVLKPPHLVTIIPSIPLADPLYNFPYRFGAFHAFLNLHWSTAFETGAMTDIAGKNYEKIIDSMTETALKQLPVIDLDKYIFKKENRLWRTWIKHKSTDEYWKRASYLDKLDQLEIPVFLQSGWFDRNGIGTKSSYLRLKKSKSKFVKMIVGPWGMTAQATTFLDDRDLNEEAGLDLFKLYHRWFEYWLKGKDTKILNDPKVQLFVLGADKWLKGEEYPPSDTQPVRLYLNSVKSANSLRGDGILEPEIIENEKKFDRFTYDPGNPTPSPRYTLRKHGKKKYLDTFNTRLDSLVYKTRPLEKEMTLAGPVTAVIYAASSAKDTDWFVTMEAVSASGKIFLFSHGAIRARYRESLDAPKPLEKEKIYKYTIDLNHTGLTLKKGSTLRIQVASSCFPYFSRNLNTFGDNETDMKFVTAIQTIYHSKQYPSHILLTVKK